MAPPDPALAEAAAVAQALLGGPADAVERVLGAGRNSRIYRVRRGGADFALKQYPLRGEDPRDRLKTEAEALSLMAARGIAAVPRALASDAARGYALLSWVAGEPPGTPDAADIDAATDFIAQVHRLRGAPEAAAQPLGAEACLSGAEVAAQLGRRLARLGDAAADEPGLTAVLDRLAELSFATLLPRAEAGYRDMNLPFVLSLPGESRTLCPSDFGFHNALRGPTGLVFLDFEYFGWDDPVKLTCDFLLHPGMQLPEPLKRRFAAAALRLYGTDPRFARRLALLYPLFAVRWCLILLNEFLPERWANRVHAGIAADWQAAKERQLGLATSLLRSVEMTEGGFPYAD